MLAGLGTGLALGGGRAMAQGEGSAPRRIAKTTKMFKCPSGFPNAIEVTPEGLWIGEQKMSGAQAERYGVTPAKDLSESAWLVDWNGKVLKTVKTPSRNTSGMAVGGGYVWMAANAPPQGIFQVDMNSKVISHRQIPLGPADNGGGCHGVMWHEGKLWISALRLRALLRVDAKTWEPEFMIPFYRGPNVARYHAAAWDNGAIWQVTGNNSKNYAEGRPGLVKYDAATGDVLEVVDFEPGSCDPHGLSMHNGTLISCDAGIHPNWPTNDSPTAGWIFRIDIA
ncbi:MAG: hypothetical protein O2795_09555 [Acidobacteria bacterium]|nr:hypothetical protein [Acidobacteriota bacterium]